MPSSIHEIEHRKPSAWINRAIEHLSREATNDALRAISILLAAKELVTR